VYPASIPEAIAAAARGEAYPEEPSEKDVTLLNALLKLTELLDFYSVQVQVALARSTVPSRLFRAYWDDQKPPVTVIEVEGEVEEVDPKAKGGKGKADKGKADKGKGKGGAELGGGAILGEACGRLLTRLRGESALVGLSDVAAGELVRQLRDETSPPAKVQIALKLLGGLLKQSKGDRLHDWLLSKAPVPFPKPPPEEDPKDKKKAAKGKGAGDLLAHLEMEDPPVLRTPMQVLVDMVAPPPEVVDPDAAKKKSKDKDVEDPEVIRLAKQLLVLEFLASFVQGSSKAVNALAEVGLWKIVDDSLRAWVPPPPEDPKDKKKSASKDKKKEAEADITFTEADGAPVWAPQPARVKEAVGPTPAGYQPAKGEPEPGYFPPLELELAMLQLVSVAVFADPGRAWSEDMDGAFKRAEEIVVAQELLLNVPPPPPPVEEPEDPKVKKGAAAKKKSVEVEEVVVIPFNVPVTSVALECVYMGVMVDPALAENVCSREETLRAICGLVKTAEHPTVTEFAAELLTFIAMMGPTFKQRIIDAGASDAVTEAIKNRSRHDRFVLDCLANAKLALHFI